MSAALLPTPNATSIGAVLLAIEGGAAPCASLDARIHEALGWLVLRGTDGRMSMRSPQSRHWLRMSQPSRALADAISILPGGWHYGFAQRQQALAWCADPMDPAARYFECYGRSPAMAMSRAGLHAQRALTIQARLAPVHGCLCGWTGPDAALRDGRCPDCSRHIQHGPGSAGGPRFLEGLAHAG